ncbi:uncharacterized protein LOC125563170 [Nematostella vectensis]|uniref:uncharacterized protein LOC125563170 n=1 Tax=Nematostella vectensis TaxID=45351 RepID=UPI0020770F7C|nr:uncharacterized protein LOC125563170 [Nematostella vectensis]
MLFTCFIDFRKAFDSIPRDKLFAKIQQAGISGNFYEVLRSMYSNDISCGKIGDSISESFRCMVGVKQGCMLSPTLFNLFLSDLPDTLAKSSSAHILGNTKLNCLLYADDLVLFSETSSGLQDLLNRLSIYSEENSLKVNTSKTKVMIFNNIGKVMNNYQFLLNREQLENVKSYKYLGLVFSAVGNFNLAKEELKKTALKALFKLRKDLGIHFRSDINLTLKLFDALIKPILLYGSEVWGADNKSCVDDRDPLESVHLKFCKMLLGTGKTAVNNACRGELGRYPLCINATYRNIKYWINLRSKEEALSKVVYTECVNNPHVSYWTHKTKEIIFKAGFGFMWLYQNETDPTLFLDIFSKRLNDMYFQKWHGEIFNDQRKNSNEMNKLRTYRTFKDKYELENYLVAIPNVKHRVALTKLRISNHQLQIEKGRHTRPYTKEKDRICPTCKNDVENEFHFLVQCQTYKELRNSVIQNLQRNQITQKRLFNLLINPPTQLAGIAARYISECFKLRETLIGEKREEKKKKENTM